MAADLWKKPSRNSASHHGGGRAQGANEIHGRLEWWSWPGGRDTIELLAGIHRRFPRTSAEYRPGLLNPSLPLPRGPPSDSSHPCHPAPRLTTRLPTPADPITPPPPPPPPPLSRPP